MTPSWYDVLDVPPDSTADEIRDAWRTAVADLDPTDRRFAVLNRAAKVLLDPEARAAHDAELAEQETDDEDLAPEDDAAVPPAPVALAEPADEKAAATKPAAEKTSAPTEEPAQAKPAEAKPAEKKPAEKKPAEKKPAEKKPAEKKPAGKKPVLAKAGDTAPVADGTEEQRRPLWVALVAGLVALLLAAVAVWAVVGSTSTERLDEDVDDAQAAAERAIVPVLSYDATDLEAGRSTALSYLTEDFGEDYAEIFDGLIEGNAEDIGAQVQATLLASAVVRSDLTADRVQVLVFVDQQTTNDQLATPRTDSNQVTVTMQRVGDEWLVDDLETGTTG